MCGHKLSSCGSCEARQPESADRTLVRLRHQAHLGLLHSDLARFDCFGFWQHNGRDPWSMVRDDLRRIQSMDRALRRTGNRARGSRDRSVHQ